MESKSINAYLTRLKVKIDACEYSKEEIGGYSAFRDALQQVHIWTDRQHNERKTFMRKDLNLIKTVEIVQRQKSSKEQIKEMAFKQSVHVIGHRKTKPSVGNDTTQRVSSIWQIILCNIRNKPQNSSTNN